MRVIVLPLALALAALGSSAHALCIYKGELYAQTTLSQEYQLEVQHAYKGDSSQRLRFFTFRNSGGFYLDRGQEHDIGGEYLLFLNPTPSFPDAPAAARGTVSVNYSCGVSGSWSSVSATSRTALVRLSR